MSFLYPEEDSLLPDSDPLDPRLKTRRLYDDDPGESSGMINPAPSPALQDPRQRPSTALSPEFTAAMDKVKQVLNERPERQKPSRWGAIAAMGIGAGAGYVNAGRRTQIDPHVTQGAIDNLTGVTRFRNNEADWKRRLEATSQAAQIEGSKIKAQQDQEEAASRLRLESAHAGAYEGDEARKRALAGLPPRPDKPVLVPRGGKLVNSTGGVLADNPIPPTPVERNITAETILLNRNKYTPEQVGWAEELRNGKKRPNAISIAIRAEGGDPDDPDTLTPELSRKVSDRLRPARQPTPGQVDTKKVNTFVGSLRMKHGDDLEAAVAEAKETLADDPATFGEVERKLRQSVPKKTGGLSDRAREALGIPKKGPSVKGKTVSRKQIEDEARRRGVDPAAAVESAKKKNYIITD